MPDSKRRRLNPTTSTNSIPQRAPSPRPPIARCSTGSGSGSGSSGGPTLGPFPPSHSPPGSPALPSPFGEETRSFPSTSDPSAAHHRSAQRPRLTSSHSGDTVSSAISPGDEIRLDGYRDVRVISVHYDDVIAARAISTTRGDQRVALKLSMSAKPSAAAQFKAEAALLARLRDAGIQNVTRVLARESGRYGAMMVAAWEDLRTWAETYSLRDRPPPPYWTDPQDLVRVIDNVVRLVRLIASIHKLNIVHNSIRPTTISNTLFSEVHLHDFSCAFSTGGADGETSPIRERGMKEESLPYLAPECSGRVGKSADYRSDYYAIGATIFEIFTGHVPFADAIDPLEIVHAHIAKRPPLMNALDPSIPPSLALIVAKLLEKSPDTRYQTAQGLIVDLERVKELILPLGSPSSRSVSSMDVMVSTLDGGVDGVPDCSPLPTPRSDFVVGSVDEAAYFRLPPASKLFGREESMRALRESFERVKRSNRPAVVIVKGHSGIGKTVLVETLRAPAVQSHGHFTSVKFDQIKSPVPFFAITQALSGLFRQLLSEPEAQLAVWRKRLQRGLGKEGRVLADVLPTLENVFEAGWHDQQPAVPVLSAQESEERFQSLVQKVLRIFARAGKPLVVLFDDLQWSTPSDLAFIRSLAALGADPDDDPLTCKMANPMLLICLWRDNEVSPTHIVETDLIAKLPDVDLTLTLEPLNLSAVSAFVSTALKNPTTPSSLGAGQEGAGTERVDASVKRLSELILEKTRGSPLFVAQLLKSFNAEGLFTFDFVRNQWQYDLDLIASKSVSTDIVELLLAQMRKFSSATQDSLKIAACLGNEELGAVMLAQAAGRTLAELSHDLHEAVQEGLLVPYGAIRPDSDHARDEEHKMEIDGEGLARSPAPKTRIAQLAVPVERPAKRKASVVQPQAVPEYYQFFHDRCQQAAYALVQPGARSAMHYAIGKRLAAATPESALNDRIFDLVQQLNHGIEILSTTDERDRLARFNYLAGTKAHQATAFEAARNYLQIAWDLLGLGGWVGQHELMSKVTDALIDVEYSLTDYAAAQEYVRIYLQHVRDDVAKLRVYARSIRCASATGDSAKAIQIGREGLAVVGVNFPDVTAEADAVADSIREKLSLTIADVEALRQAPVNTDPVASGCQAILAALVPPIYFTRIDLLGALSSLSLQLAVDHGLDDCGAFMLTLHAVHVHGKYKQLAESLAYGQAAITFFEKHGATPLACPTYKVYSSHVAVWSMTISETLPTFRQAVAYGVEYRDAEYLGFGCGELCSYSLLAGVSLAEIGSNIEGYAVLVRKFRHEISTTYIGVVQQAVMCLTGAASHPLELEGEAFTVSDYHLCREKGYSLTLLMYHMLRLMMAVFSNDAVRAQESIKVGREHLAGAQGLVYTVLFQLFESIALYDKYSTLSDAERVTIDDTAREVARLAEGQAASFRPLHLWLKAEAERAQGRKIEALALYDEAIAAATTIRYIHFAACMNERAARMLGNPKLATGYLVEAHTFWSTWGCTYKAQKMEADHPLVFPSKPAAPTHSASFSAIMSPVVSLGATSVIEELPGMQARSTSNSNSNGSNTDQGSFAAREDPQSLHVWMVDNQPNPQSRRTSQGSHGSHSDHHDGDTHSQNRSVDYTEVYGRSHLATELDLRTVVTASSVISGELSVDGVVSKLLNLALRTAGAELCLLVLDKSGTLCAEAIARSESSEVQHLRRTDAIDLQPERYPCSVINYVARSKEMVVNTRDALSEMIPDPYLQTHQPKSILCLALASQQRVIGVLYMENSQTTNAFTPDRLEILSLISGQAASTIEKARLVQDLKKTNNDLKRSQAALEASNRNLESKIADRTLELRHNNALLQAEVAEKERAQAEMRSAKEVAESATAMKSQFLANMSHEIRTPFNAVVALSSLLLDTQLTPVQTDYVETIKNSSQELLVVINDILDYTKIESDHLELSQDTVQLRSVLESSMDMVAERAASKSVEMALVINEGDIHIVSDLTRLRQIVVNLLSNAVKFTSDGEIIVTASSEPAKDSDEGKPQRCCRISVQDSGIGIAKENFGRLFRVFSQAEGAETSRNFGGTGLGLAISRKLSRLMNGDLTVQSELGKGSTFTFEWLAQTAEAPEVNPYSPQTNPDLAGKRCLIVDANKTSRDVLSQLLTSFGLVAEGPEDISKAYEMAVTGFEARNSHDLLVVDAFLPAFGAQILLRRLRQRGLSAPAIVLTRMGSPIYEEMRQLDCKFLIKPIKRNRLHHTLRSIFPSGESPHTVSPVPTSPAFPTNLAARNPLSILCAEDNPVNVKVITHLLKRMGYSSDIAEDGNVAVEKAQKKRYDLILMDLNMPNLGGLDATRKIIELMPDPAQRPSIVCLTANAMAEDKLRCLEAGADGYVSKPILVPELISALNDAGARRGAMMAPALPHVPSFELELPTSRLGRATRKASSTCSVRSGSSKGSRSGPSSPSPEPPTTPRSS
ncbi:hypothetical protein JCM5296_006141 [Sporobolomyces johnsonii]